MVCPACSHQICRRSRRKDAGDEFMFKLGLRPWRCEECEARFYAWLVPASRVLYAHCERCGNLALEQIAPSEVPDGPFRLFKLLFHIRAYRCDPCRHRFFSVLPARRMARAKSVRTPDAATARPAVESPSRPLEQADARPVEPADALRLPAMALSAWIPPNEYPQGFAGVAASMQLGIPVAAVPPRKNGKKPVVHLSQGAVALHKNGKQAAIRARRPRKAKT